MTPIKVFDMYAQNDEGELGMPLQTKRTFAVGHL
jgi:hypothetical protein